MSNNTTMITMSFDQEIESLLRSMHGAIIAAVPAFKEDSAVLMDGTVRRVTVPNGIYLRRSAVIGAHKDEDANFQIGSHYYYLTGEFVEMMGSDWGSRRESVKSVAEAKIDMSHAHLFAHTHVHGFPVRIDIGNYAIAERHIVDENLVQLVLK